jgi:hypothetical protein
MRTAETAAELVNLLFRAATSQDRVAQPSEFFGHGVSQAACGAGKKDDFFRHKILLRLHRR